MQVLDETWPLEAAELGLKVTRGRPAWAPEPAWTLPLPLPESRKQLEALKEILFGKNGDGP